LNRVVQVPPGAILGQAYDINDAGQIIGEMWFKDETGEYVYAYRYTPANQDNGAVAKLEVLTHTQGTTHTVGNIGEPTDISISYATAINDFGDMLVYSDTLHVPCIFTAAGELLPIPRSDGATWLTRDINNFCQVAGYFPTGQFVPRTPVRYTPPNVFTTFGWLKSPGKSPSGMALGINDNGVVTGYMTTLGGGVTHAFRYSDAKGLEDLGGLGDLSTRGNSINSAGSVAGDAGSGSGGTAFVYLAGRGMFDLKKSTTAVPSTLLQFGMTARRINDQEWVLGKIGHYAYLLERLRSQ
jgi:probable HAF family extracellular repeat protein